MQKNITTGTNITRTGRAGAFALGLTSFALPLNGKFVMRKQIAIKSNFAEDKKKLHADFLGAYLSVKQDGRNRAS